MIFPDSTQHTRKLYMASNKELIKAIEELFKHGEEVISFSPISPFLLNTESGIYQADWLIVFKLKEPNINSRY